MPNWVFNYLQVQGEQSDLDKLQAQLNQPYEVHFPDLKFVDGEWTEVPDTQVYSNPVFSFRNVIKPPLDNPEFAEEYYAREAKAKSDLSHTDPNWWADVNAKRVVSNHWYDWHITNWGTKWDIGVIDGEKYSETIMETDEYGALTYRFNTAWSPVPEVILELSKQYPTLKFFYEYDEEQGWGGREDYEGGELVTQEHWDIPASHADEHSNRGYCSHCEDNDVVTLRDDLSTEEMVSLIQDELEYQVYPDCPVYEKLQETLDNLLASVVEQ